MKKILSICLVLMLVSSSVMAEHVISSKDKPEFLYVLSAKSGTFEGDTLTLKDVPLVIYFSDRPDRIAGHMSLKKFVKLWGKGANSFKADPPNATLSIFNEQGNKDAVIELVGVPEVKGNSVTWSIRVLLGNLPKEISTSSLFIDLYIFGGYNGRPLR